MATAFGLSVETFLENEPVKLTVFDDDSVDAVIRLLKIKKPALLNKEVEYIKGLVSRTVSYNKIMMKQIDSDPNMNQTQKSDSFFRYKEFNVIPDLDPNADLISHPEWKGLTANLVLDIYGIFKAMKYGTAQRENYSKIDFLRDIESAESKILRDYAVSSLVEEIDIESTVSFHPQYVIKDDLFETVNPLLAMSLVLNKLESEQIGNGLKIKCVVVPALITSIYDEQKEFKSNIGSVADYLQQNTDAKRRIVDEMSVATEDFTKTAQTLQEVINMILLRSTTSTSNVGSTLSTIFVVFDRRAYGASSSAVPVHVFSVSDQSALSLSDLDHSYFVGMEMTMDPSHKVQCHLRFGMQQRMRFVPEQLVWIIPTLFGRSTTMKPYAFWCKVFDDDYKHRWSVSLRNDILSKFHHILTGNVLCSVNYHRDEVKVAEQIQVDGLRDHLERTLEAVLMERVEAIISGQRYDSDAVVEDVMVMVTEKGMATDIDSNICRHLHGPKSKGFHRLKHEVMKYLKIGCDLNAKRDIADCPLIENMIQNLIRFEQFGLEIDASNLFEFSLSPLVKGLDHLYRVHEYSFSQNEVRDHVREHVGCSRLVDECPAVKQHGFRKRERGQRRAERRKQNDAQDDGAYDEVETLCEALRDTLCSAHCYLLHRDDELYRLHTENAELRFATEVVADEPEQIEDEMKNDVEEDPDRDPLSIKFGVSVLEWLSFGDSPLFETLREEIIFNDDSTIDHELYSRMTTICAAKIEDTNYTLKEAMSLKLYTDTTSYQSELRKAHWESTLKVMKSGYYHWAMTLYEAHLFHAKPVPPQKDSVQKPRQIFHGLTRLFTIDRELPLYFGPFSTTILKSVAKHFSKGEGLMFFIAPSFQNPFRFCVGINMEMLSAFKNESEFMMYNQTVPIKKTETFGDVMMQLVNHFLFSLKNRKTRIHDVAAFFHKLGVDWNEQWIPIILKHKLLFAKAQCKPLKVIDRLFAELDIMDQRLVDPILEMKYDDGKSYVVYLIEDLRAKQLLQHYRLMTSGFTIRRYCKEINCSWLKWEPNNKMNDVLEAKDVDDSCFADATYQINGQSASLKTQFWPDSVRAASVWHAYLLGNRFVPIHGQKVQNVPEKEIVPLDFGSLLKVDAYSGGCVFVDDIPSPDHRFRIGQEVTCNDALFGQICRLFSDKVCIRIERGGSKYSFRWFERSEFPKELRLRLVSQQNLEEYEFKVKEGREDQSMTLPLAQKSHKFKRISEFSIPCSSTLTARNGFSFIGVYVHRRSDDNYKWGRLKLIKYPPDSTIKLQSEAVSVGNMLHLLQSTCFEIADRGSFLKHFGLLSLIPSKWALDIAIHPLFSATTRYRRRLVIERLTVELKIWSTEWIHRILQLKMQNKPMLQWLVEDRKISQLYDHYRVFMSRFEVKHSALLQCRWLKFNRNKTMSGKPGFEAFGDSCFTDSEHYVDGKSICSAQAIVKGQAHDISVRNTNLFGDQPVVIQNLHSNSEQNYVSHNLSDALKMDTFSNEDIFVDLTPSKNYPFRIGQRLHYNGNTATNEVITRLTPSAICMKSGDGNLYSFRWIRRVDAPKEITLVFDSQASLENYTFTITVGGGRPSDDLSSDEMYSFSNVDSFLIPNRKMNSNRASFGIYARPKDTDFEWVHIRTIDYSSNIEAALNMAPACGEKSVKASVERLLLILMESDFGIGESKRLFRALSLRKHRAAVWMKLIGAHPLLFVMTAYRRRLLIERLIVEMKLWSAEWIHRILKEKKGGKSMVNWLVEDRRVTQLYDHYRVLTSLEIQSSVLFNRRWLKFKRESKMSGKTGFDDTDESCFHSTTYLADGLPITAKTTTLLISVNQFTAKNAKLFGDRAVVLKDFGKAPAQEREQNHFLDALKVDQYSNGCVFVDDIPWCVGQKIQIDGDSQWEISRVISDKLCIRTRNETDEVISLRWISKAEANTRVKVIFPGAGDISKYSFAARMGDNEDAMKFSVKKSHNFAHFKNCLIPCRGLSNNRSDVAIIGVWAIPRTGGYNWARIKTIRYESINGPMDVPRGHPKSHELIFTVNRFMMTLTQTSSEIRNREQALLALGLQSEQSEDWMSHITVHPGLFKETAYRRKLVIERLIVELKLWSTEWIHRILEQKVKDKPMLQWLVEDRKVSQLHDHYRIFMSRFKQQYSALFNRRWLEFERNTEMNDQHGFRSGNSCFQLTSYFADGLPIGPNISAVSGDVRQITVTNTNLFGKRPITLQRFEPKSDDDYVADDFADALCFSDDIVFLNHVPSASHEFCIGQEVQCNDELIGNVCRIAANSICIKFVEFDGMISFRWFERWRIPLDLTLTFRYRDELKQFYFSAGRGRNDRTSKEYFSNISKFQILCNSLHLNYGDPISIYVKPKNGFKWLCIKSLIPSSEWEHFANRFSPSNDTLHNVNHFLIWLRKKESKIMNSTEVLERFGLSKDQRAEWLSNISSHALLFVVTAYRSTLLVERLIVDFDLLNTEMVHRMLSIGQDGKPMLNWLVENRKVRRLYDYYQVITARFKVTFRSELLDKTWLKFQKNVKMKDAVGFQGADQSIIDQTTYVLDEVEYPRDVSVCVAGIPKHICRNATLFGDRDVRTDQVREMTPLPRVRSTVPENHMSWFNQNVQSRQKVPVKLAVLKHRGHYENRDPKYLLETGTTNWYDNDGKGPIEEDWIVLEQLSENAVPTAIVIRNCSDSYALQNMTIRGSADNQVFHEWLRIRDVLRMSDTTQRFELDSASIYFAWSRGFRYFRLCSMENYGSTYLMFYEFGIYGVSSRFYSSISFAASLMVGEDRAISIRPATHDHLSNGQEMELMMNEKWIDGLVSRKSTDAICVKSRHEGLISYQWIKNDEVPTKLRYSIKDINQISKYVFAVTEKPDGDMIPSDRLEFTFAKDSEFNIPLNMVTSSSSTPGTVFIYAKPKEKKFEFVLIRRISCRKAAFCSFIVNESLCIDEDFTADSSGKFEFIATENIIITKTGIVNVQGAAIQQEAHCNIVNISSKNYQQYYGGLKTSDGSICLISGGDVVNEGAISCNASNGGSIYINTDGVFENKGTIDCGGNGSIHIECAEYRNDGTIIPTPVVIHKNLKLNRQGLKRVTSQSKGTNNIQWTVSSHRGNYGSAHPNRLLKDGIGQHYDSDGQGPPQKDWIIFRPVSKTRIFPTSIAIRNYKANYGLKRVKIEGSADGSQFVEWLELKNISKEHDELQTFVVGPTSGYFAWERAFTYFKLNVLDNHGGGYNIFYEFKINGVDGA